MYVYSICTCIEIKIKFPKYLITACSVCIMSVVYMNSGLTVEYGMCFPLGESHTNSNVVCVT